MWSVYCFFLCISGREKPRERPEQMHHPDDPKAYTEMEITDAMEDLEEFREAEYSTRFVSYHGAY